MRRLVYGTTSVVALVLIATGILYVTSKSASAPQAKPTVTGQQATPRTTTKQPTQKTTTTLAQGRYAAYSAQAVSAEGYDRTLLFFYAPWCPECRAFERTIKASSLPEGVQILKIDYDSSTDLRKRYGVTIQTTFVRVGTDGQKLILWSGYGKDKSLQTILDNTDV